MGEDPAHIVRDRAHHKAVEQGDGAAAAGAGDDPARRQEFEILHRPVKTLGPLGRIALGRGERGRDASPSVLDGFVERLAGRSLETVFHVPDPLRDRADKSHGR